MDIHFLQNLFRDALSSVSRDLLMNRKKKIIEDVSIKRHSKYAVLCQNRMILKVLFA